MRWFALLAPFIASSVIATPLFQDPGKPVPVPKEDKPKNKVRTLQRFLHCTHDGWLATRDIKSNGHVVITIGNRRCMPDRFRKRTRPKKPDQET